MKSGVFFICILVIIGLVIGYFAFYKKFKKLNYGTFVLVTGGIKTGKSTFGLYLALRTYKKVHRIWTIRRMLSHLKLISKIFKISKDEEEPLLYSNIPLTVPYVPLTKSIIMREERPRFGSVIFIDEASLLADSQLIQNQDINESVMLFVKLVGHELHGRGGLIVNSQCTQDLHYGFRRCVDRRYYVEHTYKFPFVVLVKLREERYSEDGSVVNVYNEDIDESSRTLLFSKRVWRKFDRCAFSTWTDNCPVVDKEVITKDLKVRKLISFRKFRFLEKKSDKGVVNKCEKEIS